MKVEKETTALVDYSAAMMSKIGFIYIVLALIKKKLNIEKPKDHTQLMGFNFLRLC